MGEAKHRQEWEARSGMRSLRFAYPSSSDFGQSFEEAFALEETDARARGVDPAERTKGKFAWSLVVLGLKYYYLERGRNEDSLARARERALPLGPLTSAEDVEMVLALARAEAQEPQRVIVHDVRIARAV